MRSASSLHWIFAMGVTALASGCDQMRADPPPAADSGLPKAASGAVGAPVPTAIPKSPLPRVPQVGGPVGLPTIAEAAPPTASASLAGSASGGAPGVPSALPSSGKP